MKFHQPHGEFLSTDRLKRARRWRSGPRLASLCGIAACTLRQMNQPRQQIGVYVVERKPDPLHGGRNLYRVTGMVDDPCYMVCHVVLGRYIPMIRYDDLERARARAERDERGDGCPVVVVRLPRPLAPNVAFNDDDLEEMGGYRI